MFAVTHPDASFATKAVANAKRGLRRFMRAVVEAKLRRIQREIEFHHRFSNGRWANGSRSHSGGTH
jgi:hypothetical protein